MNMGHFLQKAVGVFFSKQFALYFFFGGIATIIDWGLVYLLTSILDIWYVLSVGSGYLGGLISAYTLHRKFTFKNQEKNIQKQFFIFWSISVVGLFLTWGIVIFYVEYVDWWYMYARIFATGVMLFVNFFSHKFITFRNV